MIELTWLSGLGILLGAAAAGAAGIPPNPTRQTPPPGIDANAKKAGDEAPPFKLPAADGSSFDLREHLKTGPVAVVFYRGFW